MTLPLAICHEVILFIDFKNDKYGGLLLRTFSLETTCDGTKN